METDDGDANVYSSGVACVKDVGMRMVVTGSARATNPTLERNKPARPNSVQTLISYPCGCLQHIAMLHPFIITAWLGKPQEILRCTGTICSRLLNTSRNSRTRQAPYSRSAIVTGTPSSVQSLV